MSPAPVSHKPLSLEPVLELLAALVVHHLEAVGRGEIDVLDPLVAVGRVERVEYDGLA